MKKVLVALALLSALVACDTAKLGRLEGVVTAGPTCPVEREGEPCEDEPVEDANVIVTDEDGETVAETSTDAAGRFSLQVKPGTWQVTARAPGTMSCEGYDVEVTEAKSADVSISCDTGIR